VGKSSAILGPLLFGYLSSTFGSQRPAILSVAAFFLVGMLVLSSVKAGYPAANEKGAKQTSSAPFP
jgi:UMF1 family MFS transporter